jgi:ribosome-binding factor A
LITITKIETTEDLKHAQIFTSILPINKTGTAIRFLNSNLGRMRHFLTQRVKLFHIPDLKVMIDDSAFKARKIERELEKLEGEQ